MKKWVENILFVDYVRKDVDYSSFSVYFWYEKFYIRCNGPCFSVLQRVSLGHYLGGWNKMKLTRSYTCNSDAV